MLLKSIKYMAAFMSFILGCMDIYSNTDTEIKKIEDVQYVENEQIDYYAYLRIPSIALSRPLYSKDDERNDVDTNIALLPSSDTPLKDKGNIIIAGHNGTEAGYFKNLYKLEIGDFIYFEYENKTYKYQVDYRYFVEKNGNVEIIRDNNTKSITLITCYGKDKQLVVIGNIVD